MRHHCYQASQRPSMTIDRPPLPMSHTDPGIGPNNSLCVQRCRCHVCIEQTNISNYACNDRHQRLFEENVRKTKKR